MKTAYAASVYREGLLGGGVYLDGEKLTYRAGKAAASPRLKRLELRYADVKKLACGRSPFIFTATLLMRSGESWRFLIFARRRTFLAALRELGARCKIVYKKGGKALD